MWKLKNVEVSILNFLDLSIVKNVEIEYTVKCGAGYTKKKKKHMWS